jgi:N-acetylglutamate synthase-like GNAT family acetyltransferase
VLDHALIERWARDLAHGPQRWSIAEDAGEAVGFVGVGSSRDPIGAGLGELDTIAVAPHAWRTGVGRALMAVALDALAVDYHQAIVWTVAEYERGHDFYRATGWVRDGGTRASGREVSFRRSW